MQNATINIRKTIIALRLQLREAKSLCEAVRVKAQCKAHNIKFDKLSLEDGVFQRAMDNDDQLEHFLIK